MVFQDDAGGRVRIHPREVLVDLRRIDDEQVARFGDAIDDQIVDHATVLIEQKRVLALPDAQPIDVVRQQPVQPRRGLRAFGEKLAHVRNVEDPQIAAHRVVFVDDPRVLHGHRPAAEIDHLRAEADVLGVERRLFEIGFGGHGEGA